MNDTERDVYYLGMAAAAAKAGTCPRRQVGAVVVATNRRLSSGFNGAPSGLRDCREVGCLMVNDHCMRTVHAEVNAVLIAGSDAQGATLYSTCRPCWECSKVIINARLARVIWISREPYADVRGDEHMRADMMLNQAGITTFGYLQPW